MFIAADGRSLIMGWKRDRWDSPQKYLWKPRSKSITPSSPMRSRRLDLRHNKKLSNWLWTCWSKWKTKRTSGRYGVNSPGTATSIAWERIRNNSKPMIIVDSSVWIDYFNGQSTPQTDRLDQLLTTQPIAIGNLILTEVLQGFRQDSDYNRACASPHQSHRLQFPRSRPRHQKCWQLSHP